MRDGASRSDKVTGEIEIGNLIAYVSWKDFKVHLEGPYVEVQAGHRQGERRDLGHMP